MCSQVLDYLSDHFNSSSKPVELILIAPAIVAFDSPLSLAPKGMDERTGLRSSCFQ